MRRVGGATESRLVPSIYWQLNDPDWLRGQYLEAGRTLDDLANDIGCHDSTVGLHLNRHGIRKHHDIDETWLRREYVKNERTAKDVAAELGCAPMVVSRALRRFGIPTGRRPPYRIEKLHDLEWLRKQIAAGRTHRDIAEDVGCSRSTVSMALHRVRLRQPGPPPK